MAGESREQFTPSRTDEAAGWTALVPSVAPRARPSRACRTGPACPEQLGLSGHEKTDLGPRSPMEPYQAADPYSGRASPQQRTELDDAHGGGYGEACTARTLMETTRDFEGGKYQRGFQSMSEKGIDSIAGAFSHFSGRQAQGGFSTTPARASAPSTSTWGPRRPSTAATAAPWAARAARAAASSSTAASRCTPRTGRARTPTATTPTTRAASMKAARGASAWTSTAASASPSSTAASTVVLSAGAAGPAAAAQGQRRPVRRQRRLRGSGEYKHDPDAYGAEVNERPEGGYFGHANAVNRGGFGGGGGPFGGGGGFGGNADAPPPPGRRFQLDRSQSAHAENWTGQDAYGNDPDYEGSKFERGAQGFRRDAPAAGLRDAAARERVRHHRREPTQSSSPLQDDDMSRVSQISDPYSPVPIRACSGTTRTLREASTSAAPRDSEPGSGRCIPAAAAAGGRVACAVQAPDGGGARRDVDAHAHARRRGLRRKGQLHQVGGGVGKLNIRAWTSSTPRCYGSGAFCARARKSSASPKLCWAAAIALEVISSRTGPSRTVRTGTPHKTCGTNNKIKVLREPLVSEGCKLAASVCRRARARPRRI